ncbi:hypothetical protein ACFLUQ_01190 [Chloroflexota bacterium]
MTVYCFDIDGTICTNTDGDYEQTVPFREAIEKVNQLFDDGHEIIFFTARGYTTGMDWFDLTKKQLEDWKVKYHQLIMGKPYADFYIDDKAVKPDEFFMGL